MKIYSQPTDIFKESGLAWAIEVWPTETGFDYQLREAFNTQRITDGLETAFPTEDNKYNLNNAYFQTDNSTVFYPITERVSVNLADFQSRADYSDHSAYVLTIELLEEFRERYVGLIPTGKLGQTYNIISSTIASKDHPFSAFKAAGGVRLLTLLVPFKESSLDDLILVASVTDPGLVKVNPPQEVIVETNTTPGNFPHLPKVYFRNNTASVSADGTVDLEFFLAHSDKTPITDRDATVFLKTQGGRLNKLEIKTTNGVGVVKFIPEYLTAGDRIKVSCGFKYFSGTDDCLVTIV